MLSEFCVYTIVDGKRLRLLAKQPTAHTFPERKRWVTAERLWQRATSIAEVMPVLFADATQCDRLLFWGILTDVQVSDAGTQYTVDRLRKIVGNHSPQELVLRESGKQIAAHFIKPYALCRTPSFVADTV
jgi:hypothetical protein